MRAVLLGSLLETDSKEKAQTAIRWSRVNVERTDGKSTTTGNGRPESKKQERERGTSSRPEMKNVSRTDNFSCGKW